MMIDTPIDLLAGHDYVLIAEYCAVGGSRDAVLKGPGGETIVTTEGTCDAHGEEFRAPYTATYFIEYDDESVLVTFAPDCRKDLTTLCHLAVNHTKDGNFNWIRDIDVYRVYLNRAYTYTFTVTGLDTDGDNDKVLRLLDKNGVILKDVYSGNVPVTTLTIHPVRTDTYYFQGLSVSDNYGFRYTLTLRAKR